MATVERGRENLSSVPACGVRHVIEHLIRDQNDVLQPIRALLTIVHTVTAVEHLGKHSDRPLSSEGVYFVPF